jgi:parallel beta-helix repeat protein
MVRHRLLLATLATLPLLMVQPLLAATVQVGGCMPNLTNYPTISAAVAGVSSGTTIDVCPGTYSEQVTITKSLNLTGVASGTANQASITVPSTGLVQNTTSFFSEPVAAQVLVLGPGPVNITNITVDGTGGDMGCLSWLAGIFYASGSSGTVNRVRASNQIDSTCGVGIWAENGGSSSYTVTVQNSTVYNADSAGIFAGSGTTPTLTANLNNNVVNASTAVAAIDSDSVHGQVIGNDVSHSTFGVYNVSNIHVQTNTVIGTTYGIYMASGGNASGNQVSGSSEGVLLGASGATVSNNTIMTSTTAGVELGCFSATVSGNLINDAPVGFDAAPTSVALGTNTLANTATTVTNGCAVAALAARTAPAAPRSNSTEQWHTPATPFGTRTK